MPAIARFLALAAGGVILATGALPVTPVQAQLPSNLNVSAQVYQLLPAFPKENQYINTQTNGVVPGNTLVSRMIRYHVYVKGRAPNQRLDWKLTLADYLGANELMEDGRYPAREVLQVNPMEGDRTAIRRLNRAEREALVQVMVSLFGGTPPSLPADRPAVTPTPQATPTPPARPARSGAELLLP